jgi:hypothetical protein
MRVWLTHLVSGEASQDRRRSKEKTVHSFQDRTSDRFQKEKPAMEAVYYAARANLRRLLIVHPAWTRAQLAQATGMSRSWVA